MRRFRVLLSLTGIALVGILAAQTPPVTIAQEATPAAQAGVTFEAVAFAASIPLPATGDVSVARISFAPGTGFPMATTDPVHGLAVVERGALTLRAGRPLVVTRARALGTAMKPAGGMAVPPVIEEIATGQEVTVRAGDTVLFPPHGGGEIRNDGPERIVVLIVFVGPPVPEGTAVAGTPTS
jgi:quercetin dioxygenase-like cupin family protein